LNTEGTQHHDNCSIRTTDLKAKLYDLNAEIAALKVSIADLRQHIDSTDKEFNEKQTRLLEISLETERLSREEKVLQESYNTLATKFQVSRVAIAEAADPIRVIEQPVLPTSPVAPRKTLIVALSGVLGLFIASSPRSSSNEEPNASAKLN
jgi:tyrosine-protein kinase Etk/Wzc